MKFTTETDINKPINKVVELFDNADNMSKWMEELQSFEHISGTPGQTGAKSKLKFKMGKREIEMIETITLRNFPDEFSVIYEAKGVNNIVKNKFVEISEDKIKYITENEFQFKGFMKIIGFLMPNAFKKQSMKYLNDFKKLLKTPKTMAELKTKKNDNDIVEFLNGIDNEERRKDCFKLIELFEQWTKGIPKMWGASIIGFGSYHYKYDSGREGDWFLAGFSPRKQNLTIYITAGFSEYDEIMQDLGKYKTGKSCLYVKRLSDIDLDKLKALVEKSVDHMKKQYE